MYAPRAARMPVFLVAATPRLVLLRIVRVRGKSLRRTRSLVKPSVEESSTTMISIRGKV